MRKSAAIAVILAVGPGTQTTAFGYGGTAAVNFAWVTNSTDIGWTAQTANTLTAMTNGTYFSSLTGNNGINYYNADFATASGFLCQQGGSSTPANILCAASAAPGGYTTTGGALSGVLADLSIDGLGNITTNSGEIRRALGSAAGCGINPSVKNITYDAALTKISCDSLTTLRA